MTPLGLDIEIRPKSDDLTPRERAKARDCFVREFERQFADWSAIAKVCTDIQRDRDWELLGFKSYHQWLLNAAPRSRSYIYLVCGRYGELKDDFSDEELSQIDLDSTTTLRKLSRSVRRDPAVREAAKKKPKDLKRLVIEQHPDQLIEDEDYRVLKFTVSAASVFDEFISTWRTLNEHPEAGIESIIEAMVADYLESEFEEGTGISRRQRAEQIASLSETVSV